MEPEHGECMMILFRGGPNGWRAACSWMHITFGLLCPGS